MSLSDLAHAPKRRKIEPQPHDLVEDAAESIRSPGYLAQFERIITTVLHLESHLISADEIDTINCFLSFKGIGNSTFYYAIL
jgi:hypothetical protein